MNWRMSNSVSSPVFSCAISSLNSVKIAFVKSTDGAFSFRLSSYQMSKATQIERSSYNPLYLFQSLLYIREIPFIQSRQLVPQSNFSVLLVKLEDLISGDILQISSSTKQNRFVPRADRCSFEQLTASSKREETWRRAAKRLQ